MSLGDTRDEGRVGVSGCNRHLHVTVGASLWNVGGSVSVGLFRPRLDGRNDKAVKVRRKKELPVVTVRHVRDVTYCELQVECDAATYAAMVKYGREKILWDRNAMFAYGFKLALEAGLKREKRK